MTQYYGYQEKSFLTKMKEEGEGKGEGRRKWSTRRRKREGRGAEEEMSSFLSLSDISFGITS